jgi:hypothetical protein
MSNNATPTEVTRDIIVAMISRNAAYLGHGHHQEFAQQVAEAFDIVYQKVYEKWSGE